MANICASFIDHHRLDIAQRATRQQILVEVRFEELGYRHIFTKTLPPARFEHKIAGRRLGACGLKGSEDDVPVERVARHYAPFVKNQRQHGALRVDAQVSLEAERVDYRNKSVYTV